jgi:hypothetical protein
MPTRLPPVATVLLALLAALATSSAQGIPITAATANPDPECRLSRRRSLLQTAPAAVESNATAPPAAYNGSVVTVVKGAQALQDALQRGDPHIEIQSHLDLTFLRPLQHRLLLGIVPSTVRSIRVCFLHAFLGCHLGGVTFGSRVAGIVLFRKHNCHGFASVLRSSDNKERPHTRGNYCMVTYLGISYVFPAS